MTLLRDCLDENQFLCNNKIKTVNSKGCCFEVEKQFINDNFICTYYFLDNKRQGSQGWIYQVTQNLHDNRLYCLFRCTKQHFHEPVKDVLKN